jgi:hypothetical protein
MTTKVLLTHHHRDAMENAADRGFWMPLPLPVAETSLDELMYLTAVSYGSGQIRELLQIESFEPWREADGIQRWLPFVGRRIALPRPLPLGHRGALAGWLPRQREAVQIIDLDALLAAKRLSDVLPGSGACCHLPQGIPALTPLASLEPMSGLAA